MTTELAQNVKRSLENYQLNQHFSSVMDVDMSIAENNYRNVIGKIDFIKNFFNNRMDMMYLNFVRKDPFRSFYNY